MSTGSPCCYHDCPTVCNWANFFLVYKDCRASHWPWKAYTDTCVQNWILPNIYRKWSRWTSPVFCSDRQKVYKSEAGDLTGRLEEQSTIAFLSVRSHSGINTFCLNILKVPLSLLLHEGLTHIHWQIKSMLLFGERFILIQIKTPCITTKHRRSSPSLFVPLEFVNMKPQIEATDLSSYKMCCTYSKVLCVTHNVQQLIWAVHLVHINMVFSGHYNINFKDKQFIWLSFTNKVSV